MILYTENQQNLKRKIKIQCKLNTYFISSAEPIIFLLHLLLQKQWKVRDMVPMNRALTLLHTQLQEEISCSENLKEILGWSFLEVAWRLSFKSTRKRHSDCKCELQNNVLQWFCDVSHGVTIYHKAVSTRYLPQKYMTQAHLTSFVLVMNRTSVYF